MQRQQCMQGQAPRLDVILVRMVYMYDPRVLILVRMYDPRVLLCPVWYVYDTMPATTGFFATREQKLR